MKKTLIIIFLFISVAVSATNYYVKNSGNDSNNGQSDLQAWATIAKVNSSFSTLAAGDQILFNRGDTFYGKIIISKSGLSGNPIIIGAYGSGADPIITGLTALSSWTTETGGIYSKIISSEAQTNMVIVDGISRGMGRTPDAAYLSYESFSTTVSITDNQLSGTPDWDGAEVVIRSDAWDLDRHSITNHTGTTITYSGGTGNPTSGYGYFIQNDLRCVTATNEWYHDFSTGKFYIYGNPATRTVKVATLKNLVYNNGYDYITISNISFIGSIGAGLYFNSSSDYCKIQNCSVEFAGQDGIYLFGKYNTIDGNKISHSSEAGIFSSCSYSGNNNTITNNVINGSGLIAGAGLRGNFCDGIYFDHQTDGLIQYNTVDSSGYNGIYVNDDRHQVRNNFVNHSVINLDDGGGIYTSGANPAGRIIDGNIVLNSIGNPLGTTYTGKRSCGIYLDYYAKNVTATNNTVANCNWGMFLDYGTNIDVENNTLFNNSQGLMFSNAMGNKILNNISFAKGTAQLVIYYYNTLNDISQFGTADYNYYARPIDDKLTIQTILTAGSSYKTFSDWQTFTGKEANSHASPINIADTSLIDFYCNTTKSNKAIALAQPMIDVKGTKYANSITLLPFTSVILMVDPNPASPGIPVYTGSVIGNATPSLLEITYNVSLSSTTPPPSAFTVQVNSVVRAVNSVAISGSKVLLTLASPVVNGNVVTVAYTQSGSNPLQSTSGGYAASMGSQAVTNNVAAAALPVYISSSIENVTPGLLELVYNSGLAPIVPNTSAFTVRINSVIRAISSIAVSGTKVQISLSSPVVYGDVITIDYTKPATNPLQTASGGQAVSFVSQPVTNNVNSLTLPAYMSSSVDNSSPSLLVITYNMTLANVVPSFAAFSVYINSSVRVVNAIAVSGTKVQLTLASPVVYGDVITVNYTKPATNPLQTASGGQAVSFVSQPVTNNVILAVLPAYVNSSVENASPGLIVLVYNLSLAAIVPNTSAFITRVNSVIRPINSITVSGTKVQLTLASPAVYGDIITIDYTKPSTNPLQTTSGGQAASFIGQSVTNRVTSPTLPTYISSSIANSSPSLLVMTYNMTLANVLPLTSAFSVQVNSSVRAVNAVSVSGTNVQLTLTSPIVYGDVVILSYTKPTNNPLQTGTGAAAATISNQPVTNNCINLAPTVAITSPVMNSSFTSPANINISANATDANGSIILVEFYNGNAKIGTVSAAPYSFAWNNVATGTYSLTAVATDNNNLKTVSSAVIISVINETTPGNQPPVIKISNPQKGNKFDNPASITIDAIASDPDGTISKVEFYSGSDKLFEVTSAPFTFTWKDVKTGNYIITAVATDNLNATTTSLPIEFQVGTISEFDAKSDIINLYPNPNDGHFSIEFVNPLQNDKSEIVITDLYGKQVYNEVVLKEETIRHIDLSRIRSGIYVLMIIYQKILVTKKIIIR